MMSVQRLGAVVLLLVLPAALNGVPVHAQQPLPQEESGIWIGDVAGNLHRVQPATETFLRPNGPSNPQTTVILAVETFAESASGALAAGRLAVSRVTRAVSGFGGAAGSVRSELAYVEPRYQLKILAARWEKPRRLGFDAAYYVTVPATDPSRIGLLIDFAMGAGATRVVDVQSDVVR